MSLTYTSNTLIDSVKRRAAIPASQSTFLPDDILAFANEEMNIGLVPTILRLHEDYFLYTEDIPLVANQSRYVIPHRSIGNKLRELAFKDTNGNIFEMTRISVDDLPDYNGPYQQSHQYTYYIESNEVVLVPSIGSSVSGYLVMSYYLRPNNLVTDDRGAVISAINTSTGELTLENVPSGFTINETFDLIKSKSPFKTVSLDITSTAINTTTLVITFDPDDLPTSLAVGDYVCLSEETIVPQAPSELHVMLAHRAATRCIEAMGDMQALQNANQKLAEMELNAPTIIDNRVEGSPRKIVNRHSILRQGLFRRRYRFKS